MVAEVVFRNALAENKAKLEQPGLSGYERIELGREQNDLLMKWIEIKQREQGKQSPLHEARVEYYSKLAGKEENSDFAELFMSLARGEEGQFAAFKASAAELANRLEAISAANNPPPFWSSATKRVTAATIVTSICAWRIMPTRSPS